MRRPRIAAVALLAPLALSLAACGKNKTPAASTSPGASAAAEGATTVHLGYFANLTHATALVGVQAGIFAKDLGTDTLKTSIFNAGGDEMTALLSGAIDAAYVGPSPAVNAWAKSKAIKIISGATAGGAELVVKSDITSVAQLKGKKLATPQLGNTQDVALRTWLGTQKLKSDTSGGGDVHIVPQDNATTLDSFKSGTIDGAWVPEPWATRLVQDGGGHVLVNESSLWPQGKFVTTVLVVSTKFLNAHPQAVSRLLQGQVDVNTFLNANAALAQADANAALKSLTGKTLKSAVITAAWKNLTFTNDPVASSLATSAAHAEALGFIKNVDLTGIFDLDPLNALLTAAGKPTISAS